MKIFAVPDWEDGAEVVELKSIQKANTTDATKKKTKKCKKKKPEKQKSEKPETCNTGYRLGKGPMAPQLDFSDDEADDEMRAMHKVRSGRIEKQRPPGVEATKSKKKLTGKLAFEAVEAMNAVDPALAPTPAASNNTPPALADRFKTELQVGRFRYINERLYETQSSGAEALFQGDSTAFDAYHAGYRRQVEKWPINPLTRIIKTIKRLPKTAVIGDFGCGEGKLAESVSNKVYSMDLVSTRNDIIACNITATPLEPQALDVAVYCLSLMGLNLKDYLLEANRVLKLHGNVYIAEIQSRFDDVREFMRFMNACGFDLIKKDVTVNYFYFFHFKKMRHVSKGANVKAFSLKPCYYRKR